MTLENDATLRGQNRKVANDGAGEGIKSRSFPNSTTRRDVRQDLDSGNGRGEADNALLQAATPIPIDKLNGDAGPYRARHGRTYLLIRRATEDGGVSTTAQAIGDFTAQIVKEVTAETGERTYLVAGNALRAGPFQFEIAAEDFADSRRLKAAISAAAGARDPVHAKMVQHVGPAIKLFTTDDVKQTRRYHRTGWADGKFLIPGREGKGVEIALHRKLPYGITNGADLTLGLEAWEAIVLAVGAERGTVALSFIHQAPMAALAAWRNERYGLAFKGRTGTLKTSVAQVLLSVYGHNFMRDELLTKWGQGATANALMAIATQAHDLPIIIDNFKPSTGGGARAFINLMHNILEGGEKDRLSRAAKLRDTKPVFCWPLVTGEDLPDNDTATLARILIIPFAWVQGTPNPQLTKAQNLAPHLCAVGATWLSWLESAEGKNAATKAGQKFADKRREWAAYLQALQPDMSNILRVASNLATNQLTWTVLAQHPTIGAVAQRYVDDLDEGLEIVAAEMAESTVEALAARRFLEALRQLVATKQALLYDLIPTNRPVLDPTRHVGWQDGSGGAYLLVDVTLRKVKELLGRDALGQLSNRTLYTQLDELGMIASKGSRSATQTKSVDGTSQRILHVRPEALEEV